MALDLMHSKNIKPFGTWHSPVSSACIASDSISIDELCIHQSGVYWIEKRPAEKGRCVIVRSIDGITEDCLPDPYSAQSKVHEYGGGAYCITDRGIYFVNNDDQDIYHVTGKQIPKSITNEKSLRFADLVFDQPRNQLICVCEDHTTSSQKPANKLVAVNLLSGELSILSSDYDFYSNPRLSPDGKKLCWLCWNLPNMPWDGTELWVTDINLDNKLSNAHMIAGSDCISIFQPEWSADNILHFISDESGWWNLYNYNKTQQQLTHAKFEFGLPQWIFAQSCYSFINKDEILCTFLDNGEGELALFNRKNKNLSVLNTPWSSFSSIQSFDNSCAFIAASNKTFPEIIFTSRDNLFNKNTNTLCLKSSVKTGIDQTYFSYGEKLNFKTRDNSTAFAIYYPPANKDFISDKDNYPPLIVLTHGGPTAMVNNSLDLRKQFWTSRGFALLDVNYSGSTGFGRSYRDRLNTYWGIRDAEDCCDAALYAVEQGLANPEQLIIKGSSAGGYTVLCALTFHSTFAAGASYYGIGNLETLIKDTHKFELKYMDHLVGPYPEKKDIYKQRSPLLHVDNLSCPVIFFQGTEDKVVPKEQAEKMFEALKNKNVPVAYIPFEGEGHGFRKAETIKHALNAELTFYSKIFELNRDDDVAIKIENMDSLDVRTV